jgi:hypothetical protein
MRSAQTRKSRACEGNQERASCIRGRHAVFPPGNDVIQLGASGGSIAGRNTPDAKKESF